jgi:uncharacterized protein with HEPN domain
MDKDPAIYVRHILEAITNIETDTAGYDFEKFRADRRTRQTLNAGDLRDVPGLDLMSR